MHCLTFAHSCKGKRLSVEIQFFKKIFVIKSRQANWTKTWDLNQCSLDFRAYITEVSIQLDEVFIYLDFALCNVIIVAITFAIESAVCLIHKIMQ